jgi:hypothetical protein
MGLSQRAAERLYNSSVAVGPLRLPVGVMNGAAGSSRHPADGRSFPIATILLRRYDPPLRVKGGHSQACHSNTRWARRRIDCAIRVPSFRVTVTRARWRSRDTITATPSSVMNSPPDRPRDEARPAGSNLLRSLPSLCSDARPGAFPARRALRGRHFRQHFAFCRKPVLLRLAMQPPCGIPDSVRALANVMMQGQFHV